MTRPWEEAPLRPWEAQQPIYPRTISVQRQNLQSAGGGIKPYAGNTPDNEIAIAAGLPASIQQRRERGTPEGHVPSDMPTRTGWWVFVPASAAALGTITERDIVIDDLGKRYDVVGAYWNASGYRLLTELLEA